MLRNSARVVPVDGHLSPVQDLVLVAEDIEDEDLNVAEFQARPAGGSTAKMVPPATTFSQGSSATNTASVKRGEEEAASGVLDDKKSFRRAGLAVRTLQRQSTEALKRMHAKKAPPVRYVDYKYQSSGTLITTSSSRRRSSIPPPKAPSDPLICRSLAKLVPKRRTFRLPVYPKSTAQLARLDKASEDVPLFSGASGDVHFGIGPNKLDLKQALFLAMESKFFRPGELVIKQGERGDKFFIVESGRYEVRLKQKNNAVVHRYDNEGSFGELALLYNLPRASTVRCTEAGRCWSLDRELSAAPCSARSSGPNGELPQGGWQGSPCAQRCDPPRTKGWHENGQLGRIRQDLPRRA